MAEYDLTQTLVAHLDPHLVLPLLSHLRTLDLFDAKDVVKAQYEVSKKTNMTDYALQLYKEAYPGEAEPKEITERVREMEAKNEKLSKEAEHVLKVIEDPVVAGSLKQDKAQNFEWLKQQYQLTEEQIHVLYEYGRFRFACGKYSEASSYLYHYSVLSPDTGKVYESVLWGKLASNTLTGEWERALDDLRVLRDHIDGQRASTSSSSACDEQQLSHEHILQKRVWLLHWSLFVFFNHPSGRVKLVEMFLSQSYLNAIQMSCWWLLRYLVVALIVTRRQCTRGYVVEGGSYSHTSKLQTHAALQELSKVIQMEAYRLRPDPFVDFFRQLYVELDFDRAQEELAKAQRVAHGDFFLHDTADTFMEQARLLVSEVYCRIHQKVDIGDLSKRLVLSKEEGEQWVAKLLNETKMNATIEDGVLNINQPRPVVYQSVIDKASSLTGHTTSLMQAIERLTQQPVETEEAAEAK